MMWILLLIPVICVLALAYKKRRQSKPQTEDDFEWHFKDMSGNFYRRVEFRGQNYLLQVPESTDRWAMMNRDQKNQMFEELRALEVKGKIQKITVEGAILYMPKSKEIVEFLKNKNAENEV